MLKYSEKNIFLPKGMFQEENILRRIYSWQNIRDEKQNIRDEKQNIHDE